MGCVSHVQECAKRRFLLLAHGVHTSQSIPDTSACTYDWKKLGAKFSSGANLVVLAPALLWKMGTLLISLSWAIFKRLVRSWIKNVTAPTSLPTQSPRFNFECTAVERFVRGARKTVLETCAAMRKRGSFERESPIRAFARVCIGFSLKRLVWT